MSSSADSLRFSVISPQDHGGILWIVSSLSLTYLLLSCAVRVYISFRNFHRDTVALVLATILGFIHTVIVFAQLSKGFGKSKDQLSSSQLIQIQKDSYVSDIFFILALAAAKCSVAWFIARLTPDVKYLRLCCATFYASAIFGIAGAIMIAVKCNVSHPWITIGERCTDTLLRWDIIVGLDILTEVLLFALTVCLVWNLRMGWNTKFTVVLGFAFRLPLIALAAIHLHAIAGSLTSTNQTFDQITPSLYAEVQLGWGLISATIPCLKGFVSTLSSGYLGGHFERTLASGRGNSNSSGTYVMNILSGSQLARSKSHAGNSETISNQSLTRVSEGDDDSGTRITPFNVHYREC